jgi:hypothetical protein
MRTAWALCIFKKPFNSRFESLYVFASVQKHVVCFAKERQSSSSSVPNKCWTLSAGNRKQRFGLYRPHAKPVQAVGDELKISSLPLGVALRNSCGSFLVSRWNFGYASSFWRIETEFAYHCIVLAIWRIASVQPRSLIQMTGRLHYISISKDSSTKDTHSGCAGGSTAKRRHQVLPAHCASTIVRSLIPMFRECLEVVNTYPPQEM